MIDNDWVNKDNMNAFSMWTDRRDIIDNYPA